MARGRMDRRGRNAPSFIMLRHDMMDSPAWQSLSAEAQILWVHIRRRYNGNNNGKIPLSCREAGRLLNVSPNTAGRAFSDLQDRGFIKICADSDFRLKTKTSRRWAMTHEVLNGQVPSNEWRKWPAHNYENQEKYRG